MIPLLASSILFFSGTNGQSMDYDTVLEHAAAAEIVIVGEQHDDEIGQAWQAKLWEDLLELWDSASLSLEMLERDQQVLVDDYLHDVSVDLGLPATKPYQALIDLAKEHGSAVIASNAPRRYVKLARTDGYGRLQELSPAQRRLIALPQVPVHPTLEQRFVKIMQSHPGVDDKWIRAAYQAQRLWDATMADSLLKAETKCFHVVGFFHIDHDGGLVYQLRNRAPEVRLFTISIHPRESSDFDMDDLHRADIVGYVLPNDSLSPLE